jgi:hypothetical protein
MGGPERSAAMGHNDRGRNRVRDYGVRRKRSRSASFIRLGAEREADG